MVCFFSVLLFLVFCCVLVFQMLTLWEKKYIPSEVIFHVEWAKYHLNYCQSNSRLFFSSSLFSCFIYVLFYLVDYRLFMCGECYVRAYSYIRNSRRMCETRVWICFGWYRFFFSLLVMRRCCMFFCRCRVTTEVAP